MRAELRKADTREEAYTSATLMIEQAQRDLGDHSQFEGDWAPSVWNNVGWHYAIVSPCGRWKVHPRFYGDKARYTAFLGDKGRGGGFWSESGDTIGEAVHNTYKKALKELDRQAWYLDLRLVPRDGAESEGALEDRTQDLLDRIDRAVEASDTREHARDVIRDMLSILAGVE